MELRKVQRTNSGTFFVSLPKKWAQQFRLEKGMVLEISECDDGLLRIDPRYNAKRRPLSVTIEPTRHLYREIVGMYLLGYDEIRIQSKDSILPDQRTLIKQTSSRLVGLEIVEEDYARVVLQCLLEPVASSPEKILRREYNIAASMHRDSVTSFLNGDKNLARNVIARDVEVNRFYFLLVRILRTVIQDPTSAQKLGFRAIDCLDFRLCASLVEAIGDRAVEIAHKALALKDMKVPQQVSQTLAKFHSMVHEAQERALLAFLRHDVALAEQVRNERDLIERIFQDVEARVKKRIAEVVPVFLTAASSIYRIFGHSVDIADLVMPRKQ